MKMTIIVETVPHEQDGPDPKLIDPHTIAEMVVEEWNEECAAQGEHSESLKFVSAEWSE